MRGFKGNGRARLVIAATPAAIALSMALAACAQAQTGGPAVTATGTAAPTAGAAPRVDDTVGATGAAGGGWRLLSTQRAAHGGILSILVALPHGRAWAFGEYGQVIPYAGHPLAEYWNGSAWSAAALPASVHCGPIAAAGASSASNVWAVGIDGCVLRLTGKTWRVARDWTTLGQLTGIIVLGQKNVWVFGGTAAPAGMPGLGTWHYNGKTWQQVHGIGADVETASAASAGDIWAVGRAPRRWKQSYFLEHYSGGTWRRVYGVSQPDSVLAAGTQVWATLSTRTTSELVRMTPAGRWMTVPLPAKLPLVGTALATADGRGGIWLTSFVSISQSIFVRNEALHLSSNGKWTITSLTTGGVLLALSRIPGTTSVLALGRIGSDAALFGYGRLSTWH